MSDVSDRSDWTPKPELQEMDGAKILPVRQALVSTASFDLHQNDVKMLHALFWNVWKIWKHMKTYENMCSSRYMLKSSAHQWGAMKACFVSKHSGMGQWNVANCEIFGWDTWDIGELWDVPCLASWIWRGILWRRAAPWPPRRSRRSGDTSIPTWQRQHHSNISNSYKISLIEYL